MLTPANQVAIADPCDICSTMLSEQRACYEGR